MSGRTVLLLSGDEGTGTLAAVRGLRAAGFAVWLAVSRRDTYAARSRAAAGVVSVTDPGRDQERHVADLAAVVHSSGAVAVLPGTEGSLRAVTGREPAFGAGIGVGTCSPRALVRATDKRLLAELSRDAGLEPVPTRRLDEVDVDDMKLPVVIKPQRSVEDRGAGLKGGEAERVNSLDRLRARIAAGDASGWLVQPYLEGILAAVCGVAWRGEVVCAVHQVSPRIWPPEIGISSYAFTVGPDEQREAGVRALVRSVGWSGVFGVQFLITSRGAYVIDFNPRIYGSLALAIGAGINLPAIWASLLLDRQVSAPSYRVDVRYRAEEDDYRALVHAFRSGRRRQAVHGLLPRPRTVHAVFAVRDPAPAMVSMQKLRGRLRPET